MRNPAKLTSLLATLCLALSACASADTSIDVEDAAPADATATDMTTDMATDEADDATDTDGVMPHDPTEHHDDGEETGDGSSSAGTDLGIVAANTDDAPTRTIAIDMVDIAFEPTELTVAVGEVVRFDFVNVGQAPHEALLGDMHAQDEHEGTMAAGDADHMHDDLLLVTLESGERGSMIAAFTEPGTLWLGCHVPGHWAAGMHLQITVTG